MPCPTPSASGIWLRPSSAKSALALGFGRPRPCTRTSAVLRHCDFTTMAVAITWIGPAGRPRRFRSAPIWFWRRSLARRSRSSGERRAGISTDPTGGQRRFQNRHHGVRCLQRRWRIEPMQAHPSYGGMCGASIPHTGWRTTQSAHASGIHGSSCLPHRGAQATGSSDYKCGSSHRSIPFVWKWCISWNWDLSTRRALLFWWPSLLCSGPAATGETDGGNFYEDARQRQGRDRVQSQALSM